MKRQFVCLDRFMNRQRLLIFSSVSHSFRTSFSKNLLAELLQVQFQVRYESSVCSSNALRIRTYRICEIEFRS